MTRGELAKKLGVKISTVRYYEAYGILQNVKRSDNGYRMYSEDDYHRLGFVLRAKETGLLLKEIKGLLLNIGENYQSKNEACGYVDEMIQDVEERIKRLQMAKKALGKVKENIRIGNCPYLEKLQKKQ